MTYPDLGPLFKKEQPATDAEIYEAALQYVRKIANTRKPSKINQATFDKAVNEIAKISRTLLKDLIANNKIMKQ